MKKTNSRTMFAYPLPFITALLALVTMTGWAQTTKIATITGYSPALKDGTVATSTGSTRSSGSTGSTRSSDNSGSVRR